MNICIQLIESFEAYAQIRPVDEVKITMVGFISILGNLKAVK